MKEIISINNKIIYIPYENKLKSIQHPENELILNEPSARCLDTLLIHRDKELVTHKELYSKGWENSKQEPSPNTLYQNILLIRKGLREISNTNDDYIITVPRKGFYFNKNISIDVMHGSDIYSNSINTPSNSSKSSLHNRIKTKYKLQEWLFYGLLSIASVILFAFLMYLDANPNFKEKSSFFEDYQFVQNEGDCYIYVNKNNETTINEKIKSSIVHNTQITSCQEYPYRYITISRFSNDFYFFACNKENPTIDGFRCITTYYQ